MVEFPKTLDKLLKPKLGKPPTAIIKRDGETPVEFNRKAIANAVIKASIASGKNYDESTAMEITKEVEDNLRRVETFNHSERNIPHVEDIQDEVINVLEKRNAREIGRSISSQIGMEIEEVYPVVLKTLKESKFDPTGEFYQRHRENRSEVRDRIVNLPFDVNFDSTDRQLGIGKVHHGKEHKFDADKFTNLILERTSVSYDDAVAAVKKVELYLANRSNEQTVEKEEVISIIDATLMERGYSHHEGLDGRNVGITLDDVDQLTFSKSVENSNIKRNNPEAVNLGIAELALKEKALRDVFDSDVAEAHKKGMIHIHDLGYVNRTYCSAHSVEYIKKYGLDKVVSNLDSKSTPAKNPKVLNNHVHTFLAAIQSSYAGALGFPMLNTLYSSALVKDVEMVEGKQVIRDDNGEIIKEVPMRLKRDTLEDMLKTRDDVETNEKSLEDFLESENFIHTNNVKKVSEEYTKLSTEIYSLNISKELKDDLKGSPEKDGKEKLEEIAKQNGLKTYSFEFKETDSRKILKRYNKDELKQIAQNLVFGASQSAFSRGGQTLFIDFNIDLDTPAHVKEVPALFLGAKYKKLKKNKFGEWEVTKVTDKEPERYEGIMEDKGHKDENGKPILEPSNKNGDVKQSKEDEENWATYGHEIMKQASRDFAEALLNVSSDGDKYGNMFNFPKMDVHVGRETFEDPENDRLLKKACEVVEKNDSVYFMFDRGDGMNVSQCCRLRERITDPAILKHPEKMRFCGFQNVTINLPQASYRAEGDTLEERIDSTKEEIDKAILLALKAHTNKRRYIQDYFEKEGSPLYAMGGVPSDDGDPYIDLDNATYVMGIAGLNELVQDLSGEQLHESPEAYKLGLKMLSHIYSVKSELSDRYGMKFVVEETPGESANRRLAKLDEHVYPERAKKVLKGDPATDSVYYTNSSHLTADAPVSGLDRIILQSKMNPMIEAGAITHIFSGEKTNKANAVYDMVKTTFYETQSSQIVFSGEHTICLKDGRHQRGLKDECDTCGNDDPKQLSQKTRVVGYFSDPRSWNKSKKDGELLARQNTQDFYSGLEESTYDLQSEILKNEVNDKLRIGVIGTEGCTVCDGARDKIDAALKRMNLSDKDGLTPDDIELVKYDVATEEGRIMAAIYDAPIDVYPTVVVHKGDKFLKGGWEYPYNEKPRGLTSRDIKGMVETMAEYNPMD